MGMAASQARLLSITARLSNSEQQIQDMLNQKMRISDKSDTINAEYEASMKNTKLIMSKLADDGSTTSVDLSFKELTQYNQSSSSNMYIVTDKSGKVVITADMLNAYHSYQLHKATTAFTEDRTKLKELMSTIDIEALKTATTTYDEGVTELIDEARLPESEGPNKLIECASNAGYDLNGDDTLSDDELKTYLGDVQTSFFNYLQSYYNGDDCTLNISNVWNPTISIPMYLLNNESAFMKDWDFMEERIKYNEETGKWMGYSQPNNESEFSWRNIEDIEDDNLTFWVTNRADGNIIKKNYNSTHTAIVDPSAAFTAAGYIDHDLMSEIDAINNWTSNYNDADAWKIGTNESLKYWQGIIDKYNACGNTDMEEIEELLYKTYGSDKTAAYEYGDNAKSYDLSGEDIIGDGIGGSEGRYLDLLASYSVDITDEQELENLNNNQSDTWKNYDITLYEQMDIAGYTLEYSVDLCNATLSGVRTIADTDNGKTWFQEMLITGNLQIQRYDKTAYEGKGGYVDDPWDSGTANISETTDYDGREEAKIKYDQEMDKLEKIDSNFDISIRRLETEHKALETEYEAVKKVIDKNVESYKTFNA